MANVQKFKLTEAGRLLSHCSRQMRYQGGHIDEDRTPLNYNMAEGLHEDMTDYEFAKSRTHEQGIRRLNRDDVKDVCSWVVTMPKELCHGVTDENGEEYYVPNDTEECREFFTYAYDFFKQKHGEENVVSSYVHMDENVPHMHFIFTPIVRDKERGDLKVCAKESLHDCYGAKFQIELQDYISSRMGKELHMVRQETVDYERNVKELKKKGLNAQCAYLGREIAKAEEELERKRSELNSISKAAEAAKDVKLRTSSSNGYTVMKDNDFKILLQQVRYIAAMEEERKQVKKMLEEFERTNQTEQIQDLEEEAKRLSKENDQMKEKLDHLEKFMDEAEEVYGFDLRKDFDRFEKEQRRKDYERSVVIPWEK